MLKSLGKMALAGATIFGIGMSMVVLQGDPDAPVAEAEADITMLNFAPRSDQQKFVNVLAQEGMEEPRAYDHNGNKMFFSTVTTNESPRQVLERFQRAFVDNGMNDHVHMAPPPEPPGGDPFEIDLNDPEVVAAIEKTNDRRRKWVNDYFGGMVPAQVTNDTVIMAGATSKEGSGNADSFALEALKAHKEGRDIDQTVDAMRYMDVVKEDRGRSRITAIWSEEGYNIRKMLNMAKPGEDLGVDPTIPVCPGCERLMHFKGETEEAFDNHAFQAGPASVGQALGFYERTLPARGWEPAQTNRIMRELQRRQIMPEFGAEMRTYTKGHRFLTVMAWDDGDKTSVHIARSN